MSAPAFEPDQRDPAQVAAAETYQRRDRVWVHRHGEWHLGVVDGSSWLAVIVTYHREGMRGTVVDTVPPECLVRRGEPQAAGGDR